MSISRRVLLIQRTRRVSLLETAHHSRDGAAQKKILECVDKSLEVFGSNAKFALYWRMEHEFGFPREDIPKKPEIFTRFLEYMFGSGSKIALSAILREMSRVSGNQNLSSTSFPAAVKELEMLSERE